MKLGMVMDPIQHIIPKKDSSLAMLLAAQQRGWELHYMEMGDLFLEGSVAKARTRTMRVEDAAEDASNCFSFQQEQTILLADLDVILMRKDPPFDREYLYATLILEQAEAAGALVVNRAQALRDYNEKLSTVWFPELCPPTLVTRNHNQFRDFLEAHGEIILKPLDSMGGNSIFRVHQGDPNTHVVFETLTWHQTRYAMAQKFLPEIRDGDKRILMVNGEAVPYALARVPVGNEHRGNLAAGGRGEGVPLSVRDWEIAKAIGPVLREKGLLFVGLDVIGDWITEINVTSPTCIRELDEQFGLDIAGDLMEVIDQQVAQQPQVSRKQ